MESETTTPLTGAAETELLAKALRGELDCGSRFCEVSRDVSENIIDHRCTCLDGLQGPARDVALIQNVVAQLPRIIARATYMENMLDAADVLMTRLASNATKVAVQVKCTCPNGAETKDNDLCPRCQVVGVSEIIEAAMRQKEEIAHRQSKAHTARSQPDERVSGGGIIMP